VQIILEAKTDTGNKIQVPVKVETLKDITKLGNAIVAKAKKIRQAMPELLTQKLASVKLLQE
jgi:hypothetical protein